jgi:copper chaperone CopZ
MTHTYRVTGMTCGKCAETVKSALSEIPGVKKAEVTIDPPAAVITMESHIPTALFNEKLAEKGNYSFIETNEPHKMASVSESVADRSEEKKSSFLKTYKPVLLVFGYLLAVTILNEIVKGRFNVMAAMNIFMGGFFLVFSFFKLLDLKGFAYSYMSYDIVAAKWLGWGYIYPFVELLFAFAYLFHFDHTITNISVIAVMSLSSVGVIAGLAAKRKIQCACLGTVFNLPMSNITLIEDLLMVLMAAVMLFL